MNNDACAARADTERIARYVADTLPQAEVEEFEVHLLECATCEAAVREAATFAAGVRHAAVPSATEGAFAGRRGRRRIVRTLVPLVAVAAAVALIVGRRGGYADLAGVTPPPFEAFSTRAAPGGTSMDAYTRGDYGTAAIQLDSAARRAPEPGTFLFLGVSYLMVNDLERARPALESALLPDANPYSAEAHFYLAKLYLRRESPDSALVQLERVAIDSTALSRHARALKDSVQARLSR